MSNSPLKYTGTDPGRLANARDTGVGRDLLNAAMMRRDELRARIEDNGARALTDTELRTTIGEINAFNWLIGLPGRIAKLLSEQDKGD